MSVQEKMTAIADAIRVKTGGTDALTLDQMAEAISGLETGGASEQELFDKMVAGKWPSGEIVLTRPPASTYFSGNPSITSIVLRSGNDSSDKIPANCFRYCNGLKSLYIESAIFYSSNSAFANCLSLREVIMTKDAMVDNLDSNLFYACSALVYFDASVNFLGITHNSFAGCSSLSVLVLRKTDSPVLLKNTTAFTNTPFAEGGLGGTIYVPESLIESYKTAPNWSAYDAYGTITWKAIEGSEYE